MSTAADEKSYSAPSSQQRDPDVVLLARPGSEGTAMQDRPRVHGKFLVVGDTTFHVRGVTYGPFCAEERFGGYGDPERVERDLAQIAAHGFNTLRTYTVPPRRLLDAAVDNGLRVMVGIPWEQHVAFLERPEMANSIEARVRAAVQSCAGHPALLCYAVGNEIPASIVRWHGRKPVERFIERLYRAAKDQDPDALVTYVNYPSTEYLQLPFLDFVSFNVYLEEQRTLRSYLARLQTLAGDRPLLMAEIGLDSRSHGDIQQAHTLEWQVRTAFEAGCAGATVFSWTDEWYRGGQQIEGWSFGLTTSSREPKPALAQVEKAFAESPAPPGLDWPRISVVVCTFNGSRTIDWCLDGLGDLDYPDFEVIVVDDGSTDDTAERVRRYPVRLINTPNRGLSHARNAGMEAAGGEIVAYIDDDARPDPHWLTYLAITFRTSGHVGVGGPNLPPNCDGPIADCVANAPGGPIHVLISDEEAEHIPGCNMAFRTSALERIGGFDTQFWVAGDDVDACWRLQEQGFTLGYSPAAVVWHRRRPSIRAYWKQQKGYGKAEALLERKWPEKYNAAGHLSWAGRLYGNGLPHALAPRRHRIYHGVWGSALFQSIYEPAPGFLASLPLMPEWYLLVCALAALSVLGVFWHPLLAAVPLLLVSGGALLGQSALGAAHARFIISPRSRLERWGLRVITALLYLIQPPARLAGRMRHGLTPWRSHPRVERVLPRHQQRTQWSEQWQSGEERLRRIGEGLKNAGYRSVLGGAFDRWDLEVRRGLMSGVRVRMAIEEHGEGRQLVRIGAWPVWSPFWMACVVGLAVPGALALLAGHPIVGAILLIAAAGAATWAIDTAAATTATVLRVLSMQAERERPA